MKDKIYLNIKVGIAGTDPYIRMNLENYGRM